LVSLEVFECSEKLSGRVTELTEACEYALTIDLARDDRELGISVGVTGQRTW